MTIEEKAKEYAERNYSPSFPFDALKLAYIKGATEQQEIVIKRACDWLKANSYSFRSDEFLEPLVEAMKGE